MKRILESGVQDMIKGLAKKFDRNGVPSKDLESAAVLECLRAVSNFDKSRGVKITTYLYPFALGAMWKELAQNGHLIKVPYNVHQLMIAYRQFEKDYFDEYGIMPGFVDFYEAKDIAQNLDFEDAVWVSKHTSSIDAGSEPESNLNEEEIELLRGELIRVMGKYLTDLQLIVLLSIAHSKNERKTFADMARYYEKPTAYLRKVHKQAIDIIFDCSEAEYIRDLMHDIADLQNGNECRWAFSTFYEEGED